MTQNKPHRGTQSNDELLTLQEVADRLKVTTRTVRSMIDEGELPALKVGSRRIKRVKASALDKLLTEVRTAGSWSA